jgi:lipid A 4'-phosphatase
MARMNRTGLIIVLGLATVVGVVFGLYPQLDLAISSLFQHQLRTDLTFGYRFHPGLRFVRDAAMWVPAILVAPAVVSLAVKLVRPNAQALVSWRAIIFLVSTLALAPGVMSNVLLKEYWPRSRPVDVVELGGTNEHFVPWWDPRGDCPSNCAFVSGDVSGAFWTIAPAALAPAPWRPLAYGGAIAFGSVVAAVRILAGGHFFTDVFFAGVFTFLIIWLVYGLIYRWPGLSEETVERWFARRSRPMITRGDGETIQPQNQKN